MQRVTSPQTGDSAIEAEIKAKGLTAPRITLSHTGGASDTSRVWMSDMHTPHAAILM